MPPPLPKVRYDGLTASVNQQVTELLAGRDFRNGRYVGTCDGGNEECIAMPRLW